MIWRSIPSAIRFSVAYALVFLLAMVADAQNYGPQPPWAQPYQPPTQRFEPPHPAAAGHLAAPPQSYTQAPSNGLQAQQPAPPQLAHTPQYQQPNPSPRQSPLAALGYSLTPRLAARVAENANAGHGQTYTGSMDSALNGYGQNCAGGNCDAYGAACAPAMDCRTVRWGGRAGFLFLDRTDENHRFYSYDSADESYQLLDSRDANFDIGYGVEGWISRFDCCRQRGFEIGYWGIYPGENSAFAYPTDVTGVLNGIFNFDQLDYNGTTADTYVNAALVHRMRRESEIHNAEFNWLWGLPLYGGEQSPWTFRALAGFRFFRIVDNLEFGSDTIDTAFTGAVDELYYAIDTENNLYGLQFGGVGERRLGGSRWSATWGAKAGVFGNQAEAGSFIGGAAGAATVNNGPNSGRAWDIRSTKDDVAFLGEVQAGVGYQLGMHWRLLGQYRVVGISGLAMPTNQIYQDLRGLQDVELLATNGSLILHGAFVGAERAY